MKSPIKVLSKAQIATVSGGNPTVLRLLTAVGIADYAREAVKGFGDGLAKAAAEAKK